MNIGVRVSLQIGGVFFGYIHRSGTAGSYGGSVSSSSFSTVDAPIYIPTNSVPGFLFLNIHVNICCVVFNDSHSNRCDVISHCGLNLYFSD